LESLRCSSNAEHTLVRSKLVIRLTDKQNHPIEQSHKLDHQVVLYQGSYLLQPPPEYFLEYLQLHIQNSHELSALSKFSMLFFQLPSSIEEGWFQDHFLHCCSL